MCKRGLCKILSYLRFIWGTCFIPAKWMPILANCVVKSQPPPIDTHTHTHTPKFHTDKHNSSTSVSSRLFMVSVHIVSEYHHLLLKGMLCAGATFINHMCVCIFGKKKGPTRLNLVYYSKNPTATHSQPSFQD